MLEEKWTTCEPSLEELLSIPTQDKILQDDDVLMSMQ